MDDNRLDIQILFSAINKSRREFQQLDADLKKSKRAAADTSKALSSLRGHLAGIAGAMGVGLGLDQLYRHTEDYDSALRDMAKVTDESFSSIEQRVSGLDDRLGTNAELVRGYYQTISAGVTDPVAAQEMLTEASKAARAAHEQQAEVIKGLTKYMAGFGDEVHGAADAADALFTIERLGQTSFKELIPLVGELATVSRELGVGQEEMGGSMAALTQISGTTSEAATKYRAVLISLIKPQERMRALLTSAGYSSGQQLVDERGLIGALKLIRDRAAETGTSLGMLMESQEALIGVSALLANNGRTVGGLIEQMGQRAGAAQAAFDNWTGSVEAFRLEMMGTLDDLAVELGDDLKPMIRETFGELSTWTRDNKDAVIDGIRGIAKATGVLAWMVLTAGEGYGRLFHLWEEAIRYQQSQVAEGLGRAQLAKSEEILRKVRQGIELTEYEQSLLDKLGVAADKTRDALSRFADEGPDSADIMARLAKGKPKPVVDEDGAKKAAAALEQVRDATARLTLSQSELARRDFAKQVDDWAAALGRANPELQALIDKQTTLFDLQEKFSLQPYQVTELSGITDGWLARDRGRAEADQRGEQMLRDRLEGDLQLQVEFAERFREVMLGETQFKLAQIDAQAEAYRRAGVDEVAVARWVEREKQQISRDGLDGIKVALEEWADAATNAAEQFGDFLTTNLDSAVSNLSDQLIDGEADWNSWGRTALKQLTSIILQLQIMGPLAKALSGTSLSEAGGIFSAFFHGGGVVGREPGAFARAVPASAFVGAPRYHSGKLPGLAPDEVAAVLRKNEAVFTPEQLDALGRAIATGSGEGTTRVQVDVGEGLVARVVSSPQFENQTKTVLKRNPELLGRS